MKIINNNIESINKNNIFIFNKQSRDIRFKLRNDLIYYTFDENKKQLYMFAIIK